MLFKISILWAISACFIPAALAAQYTGHHDPGGHIICGRVVDKATNKGIGFATVAVLQVIDSAVITGVLSKEGGDFQIGGLPAGRYILEINFIGYKPLYHDFSISQEKKTLDLGNLEPDAAVAALKAVKIVADKAAWSLDVDKKVFDPSGNITAAGGNALDILSRVPGVQVDADGKVTVRNGSPVIFVNGKRTLLTLDEIPAENVDKIEVMTNPSAQYDASGMAGILNIILKKNRKPGISGMVSITGELRGKYKGGANLNIYRQPFNLSLGYYMKRRKNEPYNKSTNRHNLQDDTWLSQHTGRKRAGLFQTGQLELDYSPGDRNIFALTGSIIHGIPQNNKTLQSNYLDSEKNMDSSRSRHAFDKQVYRYYSGDLNYKHTFPKEGHELKADANLQTYTEDRQGKYITHFFDHRGKSSGKADRQITGGNGSALFFTGQVDYVNPVSKNSKLEAGLKATVNQYRSVYDVYDMAGEDSLHDDDLSGDYSYHEHIYAGYIQFAGAWHKFGYEVGVRAERYRYAGAMPGEGLVFTPESDKTGLYPGIFLSYRFSPSGQLQLNYSRRVKRPDFLQRIPYTDYTDPLNLSRGNPGLRPEYANAFEMNYNKLFGPDNLLVSLYFKHIDHQITAYTAPYHHANDTLITYAVNAENSSNFGAEITFQGVLTHWWNVTADVNVFQNKLAAEVESVRFSNSRLSGYIQVGSGIRLPANFTLQVSGDYHAPVAVPRGTYKEFGKMDLAVQKQFLKRKNLTLTVTYADIFKHRKGYFYEVPGVFSQNSMAGNDPYLKVNLTWNFGDPHLQLFKKDKNDNSPGEQIITPLPGNED